ncbi:hypothetical protein EJ110_NYTH38388 [Nymphaea thermarum]|nr:hypothetical protein EJ110_NYTH38388 [Nymphaea thermarum]
MKCRIRHWHAVVVRTELCPSRCRVVIGHVVLRPKMSHGPHWVYRKENCRWLEEETAAVTQGADGAVVGLDGITEAGGDGGLDGTARSASMATKATLESEDPEAPSNASPVEPLTTSPTTLETTQAYHQALTENHHNSHLTLGECPEEIPKSQGREGLEVLTSELKTTWMALFLKREFKKSSMAVDVQMLKAVNATPSEAMPKLVVIDTDQDMAIDPGGGAPKRDGQTNSDGSQHGEGKGKETLHVGAVEPNHHERRCIQDSILLAQELIHSMEARKSKSLCMKIDFRKAYDRVSWEFLENAMQVLGFDPIWIQKVMTLVRTVSMTVVLNAYHMKSLKTIKGILQDLENCSGLKVINPRITVREAMYGPNQALRDTVNRWRPDIATLTMVDNQADTLVWANQHSCQSIGNIFGRPSGCIRKLKSGDSIYGLNMDYQGQLGRFTLVVMAEP